MNPNPPILHLDPEPSEWAPLISSLPLSDEQRRFRNQLGLPTDRPLVLSGHQPTIWHPGILAKHLAAVAFAESIDAHTAWLVVEHVEVDAHTIDYPAGPDSPRRARLPIAPPPSDQTIASRTRSLRVSATQLPASSLFAAVDQGTASILHAITDHESADPLSEQITLATNDLLAPFTLPLHPVYSSRLTSTDLFTELLEKIRTDPVRAAKTHNIALRAVAHTGVIPLSIDEQDPGATELPLWVIREDGSRRKAIASDLESLPPENFAPRVLFNTGIVRLAGCDLFIHGVGGAAYDKATEHWFHAWLGRELAPAVLASADLFFQIERDPASSKSLDRARWTLHHARHNPAVLGDHESASKKSDLLTRIRAAQEAGQHPDNLFREMHDLLDQYRKNHAPEFDVLRDGITEAQRAAVLEALATDRSWAFPLYPREQLVQLNESIQSRFQRATCSAAC